jgi:hypothetical protein
MLHRRNEYSLPGANGRSHHLIATNPTCIMWQSALSIIIIRHITVCLFGRAHGCDSSAHIFSSPRDCPPLLNFPTSTFSLLMYKGKASSVTWSGLRFTVGLLNYEISFVDKKVLSCTTKNSSPNVKWSWTCRGREGVGRGETWLEENRKRGSNGWDGLSNQVTPGEWVIVCTSWLLSISLRPSLLTRRYHGCY